MPNWNANNILINGKTEDILLFIKENFMTNENPYKDNDFGYILDFEAILPTPINSEGNIIDDWYDWRHVNWGCKWSPNFEQCISLTLTDDEKDEDVILYDYKSYAESNKFDETTILGLYSNLSNIKHKEASLLIFCETPWCPPESIIGFWRDRYAGKDIELNCKFYEPGVGFAGEIGFTKDGEIFEVSYGDDEVEYIEYLLDEGWESLEYYIDDITDILSDIHDDLDKEEFDLLVEKVKETLENAPDNKSRAILINDIREKWRTLEK